MRGALVALRVLLIAVMAVFALLPFYIMLKSSFEPYNQIVSVHLNWLPTRLDWYNYVQLFSHHPMLRWLFNSLFVAVSTVLGSLIIDSLAAFSLTRLQYKGRNIFFVMILASLIVPIHVIIVPLYVLMRDFGWLDSYYALIIPMMASPFGIFLLRQHFIQLPKELDEAALLDGTSRFGILWKIVIPNSLAAIGTITVIKFMWTWGDYMWPALVSNTDKAKTMPVGIASFQYPGGTMAWDLVMSGSVIAVIPIVVIFLYFQKYFVKGLTEGAIKG